jgi:hypothetical protein
LIVNSTFPCKLLFAKISGDNLTVPLELASKLQRKHRYNLVSFKFAVASAKDLLKTGFWNY